MPDGDSQINHTPLACETSLNGDGVTADTAAKDTHVVRRFSDEETIPPQHLKDLLGPLDRPLAPAALASPVPERAVAADDASTPAIPAKKRKKYEGHEEELLTDRGNAQRFVHQHGEDLRYVGTWGKWLAWDKKRWQVDDTRAVEDMANRTVRSLYIEASEKAAKLKEALKRADAATASKLQELIEQMQALIAWAKRSEAAPRLAAIVSIARSERGIPITHKGLDCDPWLFNVENGTLNLKTKRLTSHRRKDSITKLCSVAFDHRATCPVWDRFVDSIFLGDKEMIDFNKKSMGRCLTGDISEQILWILYGLGGNGKSTYVNAILDVMGPDYSMQAPDGLLTERRGERHPCELACLFGKRLVVVAETDEGSKLNEGLIKKLTGGEDITARFMREDFWTFPATFKVLMLTNHKPRVRGGDDGIWRRLRLIPFEARFHSGDEPQADEKIFPSRLADKRLPEKLRSERAGILRWLVEGCFAWQREGLSLPEQVKVATAEYRAAENTLDQWIEDACMKGADLNCKASELLASFNKWTVQRGEHEVSHRTFGERLKAAGYSSYLSNGTRYKGLGLRTMEEPDWTG